jgi:hypothetical protein
LSFDNRRHRHHQNQGKKHTPRVPASGKDQPLLPGRGVLTPIDAARGEFSRSGSAVRPIQAPGALSGSTPPGSACASSRADPTNLSPDPAHEPWSRQCQEGGWGVRVPSEAAPGAFLVVVRTATTTGLVLPPGLPLANEQQHQRQRTRGAKR